MRRMHESETEILKYIKRLDLEFTDIIVFGQILLNVLRGVRLYLEKTEICVN